tara:strand:- start:1621 stop:2109 length:489 start_codon:yes stop_codon:yes gene_type:complete
MPKDFKKHFTKDLGKAITKGRKEVAKTVVRSLTEKGPWWTGTFGENWIVSKSPVQATKKRKPDFPNYLIPDPTARQIKNPRVPNVTLKEDLFIGNRAKYAGFAINAPGQTRPSISGQEVTYAQHGQQFSLTATGGPNWYNIYTKGGLINKDIALAFKKVGFR